MDLDALAARRLSVWHATFAGGWSGIQRTGLHTAAGLLHHADRGGEASVERSEIVRLSAAGGQAVLRDQRPNRKDPAPCLDGLSVSEWWLLLNSRSYFFPDRPSLDRLVASYLRRGLTQEVITFDTARLLAPVESRVEVATVNAGVFPRKNGPSRGRFTFQRLSQFSDSVSKIKEVTITVPIPTVDAAVIDVTRFTPGHDPVPLWPEQSVGL